MAPFDARTEVWMSKHQMFIMQFGYGLMLMVQTQVLQHLIQSNHTLTFNPFLTENQGNYCCCLPDQSSCSNVSVVRQSSKLYIANELCSLPFHA